MFVKEIILHDVGLRDGLQIEKELVPLEKKIYWAQSLIEGGIDIVQLGSFVNPQKVPQMADTEKLFEHIKKNDKTILSALVLNEKGLQRGLACGVEMFCMGVSASNTHSLKNTGMETKEALKLIIDIAKKAIAAGKKVQVSVQSAFGCGYEGKVSEEKVLEIVKEYINHGLKNISLADTAGHANPSQVENLFGRIYDLDKDIECACHFHDTYGLGLANCYAALKMGIKYFETSFAGLGGCPFTAIVGGNVCTEDFVHMLQRMGLRKEIKLEKLIEIARDASQFFKRTLPGFLYRTGPITKFDTDII